MYSNRTLMSLLTAFIDLESSKIERLKKRKPLEIINSNEQYELLKYLMCSNSNKKFK